LVVHCQAGARAAIAASVLSARGVADLRLYGGGYTEWSAAGHPTASGAA
jgi:hydroxyacylglutathione hydrolase